MTTHGPLPASTLALIKRPADLLPPPPPFPLLVDELVEPAGAVLFTVTGHDLLDPALRLASYRGLKPAQGSPDDAGGAERFGVKGSGSRDAPGRFAGSGSDWSALVPRRCSSLRTSASRCAVGSRTRRVSPCASLIHDASR